MATHSSKLAWKIPWTEEPGRLLSMGSLRVRHDWATSLSLFTFMHWRRKWQPTPVFFLENPRDRGAWRAAVYGVTQSWTRLKRLSSSSSGGSSSPKSLSEFLLIQQPAPLVLGIFFSLKTQEQVKTSKNGFSTHCVEQRIIRKNTYCFFYDLKKKLVNKIWKI